MAKVLIVDDEDYAVEGIRAGVRWNDLGVDQVYTAFSVKQAREIVLQSHIDVIICDIEMPQESGIDFLFWLRQSDESTEFIFLTCHDDFSLIQQALRLDCLDFLVKPVDGAELTAAVRKALRIQPKEQAIPSGQTGAKPEKQSPAHDLPPMPDITRWTILLENGAKERVRHEIRSYISQIPSSRQRDPLLLRRVMLDIQQAATAVLRTRSILPHQLLSDAQSENLFRNAADNPANLLRWVDYMLEEVCGQVSKQDTDGTPFGKACEYISKYICGDLSCESIASYVSLNPDYLTRLFKKETGLSISEYVTRARMIFASELLKMTKRPVSDIAIQLGYANPSHFSKVFKKAFGKTPVEYRGENSPRDVVQSKSRIY
jgi:two-component system, response regulator YesN